MSVITHDVCIMIYLYGNRIDGTQYTHTHTRPHSPKILRVFHMHRPTMTEVSNNFGNLPTTARANYFNLNHYNIVFGGQNHNTMHRYAISGGEGGGGCGGRRGINRNVTEQRHKRSHCWLAVVVRVRAKVCNCKCVRSSHAQSTMR